MSSGSSFFHVADYVVLVLMLVFSLGIGLYYAIKGQNQKSSKEYFTASGTMSIIPAGCSLLASVLCSVWYIGVPPEVYYYGFHFATDFIFIPISLGLVSVGILPVFYELKVTSANEYLERRFNKGVRTCGSILYVLNSTLYVSLVMFIPALSVSQVTGLHLWVSVTLMCVVGTIYTAVGGIRAVMWTDLFQMLIIYASLLSIAIKGSIDLGGVSAVINKAVEGHRIKMIPTSFDPRYRYNIYLIIACCFTYWLGLYGTYQTQVQRYLSCPSQKSAIKALWLNVPAFWFVEIVLIYIGFILYAKFADCDPEQSKTIDTPDEIFTYYVMKSFEDYPGLPGLFVAGVFSGALSTISSCLNSMSAVTMEDFVLAIPKFRKMHEDTRTKLSRWLALFYGLLTMAFMVVVQHLESIVSFYMYNNGAVMGCLSGLFVLGMFVPWANSFGAVAAFAIGGGISFAYVLGCQFSEATFHSEVVSVAGCELPMGNITSKFFNSSANESSSLSSPIPYDWIQNSLGNFSSDFINMTSNVTSTPSSLTYNRISAESAYNFDLEPLYRVLPENSFEFMEIFAVSPFLMQPLTFSFVLLIGSLFSAAYRLFHDTEEVSPSLLSPIIRMCIAKPKKRSKSNKYRSGDDVYPKSQMEKLEEHQTFLKDKSRNSIGENGLLISERA